MFLLLLELFGIPWFIREFVMTAGIIFNLVTGG